MESEDNLEIVIEMVPIVSLLKNNFLIKLPDSAYGEWIIFKKNVPVFYLNIFDPAFVKLKNIFELKKIGVAGIVDIINEKTNEHYSVAFKYWGLLNYKKKETMKILIQKFPLSFLEYFD